MVRSLSAFGLIWLLGCSNSPPPIVVAPVIEVKASDWKAPEKPKETDAAAKKLLGEMISAHTGGKPEKLAKLTSISLERTGIARTSTGGYGPLGWQEKLVGKRKYHATFKNLIPGGDSGVYILDGAKGAYGTTGSPLVVMNASNIRDVTLQIGEDSCLYLFGLNDPEIIAQTAIVPNIGEKPMLGLHVWSPTIEHMLLTLDAKTKRLTRLQYMGTEAGTPALKDALISGHREIDGLIFPEKYHVAANGLLLFEWEKLTFEAGGVIDPKLFEVP
jgi:hypothetical protein